MELRPALALQAAIKAMMDVVLPAVDPHNKLAQEQARLVVGVLGLMAARMPLLYRYERDELARFVELAETLESHSANIAAAQDPLHALQAAVASGKDVIERARAEPAELEAANFALREHLSALVTVLYTHADTTQRKAIGAAVTAHAQQQLLRERAWHVTQGWESDPQSLPAIASLLP